MISLLIKNNEKNLFENFLILDASCVNLTPEGIEPGSQVSTPPTRTTQPRALSHIYTVIMYLHMRL